MKLAPLSKFKGSAKLLQQARATLLASAILASGSSTISAAEVTWTGPTTSSSWNTGSNWSTAAVPGAQDLALFTDAFAITLPSSAFQVGGIWVDSTKNGSLSGATTTDLTLNGVSRTINGEQHTLLLGNGGTATFTLNANVTTMTIASSGVIYTGANISLTPKILETGGSHSITKLGSGTLTMGSGSANSTFSGGFILEEGVVNTYGSGNAAFTSSPFGLGVLTLKGGGIRTQGTGARTYYNAVDLDGGATLGNVDFNGDINILSTNGTASRLVNNSQLNVVNHTTWGQEITGSGSLTKSGEGTLLLTKDNSYTGNTIVTDGSLIVNGSLAASNVEVRTGGTLGGKNTTSGGISQNVVVKAGGNLSPGYYSTAGTTAKSQAGTLNVFGDLTLESDSNVIFHLGVTSDSIYSTGSITLDGANLSLLLTAQPLENDVFVLFHNDGFDSVSGHLKYNGINLGEGAIFSVATGDFSQMFSITYGFNNDTVFNSVALTAVPEASSLTLLGLIGAGALLFRGARTRMKNEKKASV